MIHGSYASKWYHSHSERLDQVRMTTARACVGPIVCLFHRNRRSDSADHMEVAYHIFLAHQSMIDGVLVAHHIVYDG